jgi:hypothetical protein
MCDWFAHAVTVGVQLLHAEANDLVRLPNRDVSYRDIASVMAAVVQT